MTEQLKYSLVKKLKNRYGRKGCFGKGTLVSTPEGEVFIEDLRVGDSVLVFDDKNNYHKGRITEFIEHEDIEVYEYSFWGDVKVIATKDHYVLNQYSAFVPINSLGYNDFVFNHNNHLLPLISKKKLENQKVYNLEVEPWHTFVAQGIKVHNGAISTDLRNLSGRKGGGKGGGGDAGEESPNSLKSRAIAKAVDLISEGEIYGLVDGEKSIFYDGTPLKGSSGTYNFRNVVWDIRYGTPDQNYIPGFSDVESEVGVFVEVTNTGGPITRTLSNLLATSARITVRLPSLVTVGSDGDLGPNTQHLKIEVKPNGGGFVTVVDDSIIGKCTSPYNKAYRFTLPGSGPWDLRVTKLTTDAVNLEQQVTLIWDSYTEIIDFKFFYPDSAYFAQFIDAEQFDGRVPARAYEIYGIICPVPSNYGGGINGSRIYTGIWDFNFQRLWTDNPVWILYEVLSNPRYWGEDAELFGTIISEDNIDLPSFYQVAQYCDELVSNGRGGIEPRFTFNAAIIEREDAFNVINAIVSSFRGMIYWAQGKLYLSCDMPGDIVKIISPANVVNGYIAYQGTSLKTRSTAALVSFNDPTNEYKAALELYEDEDRIRTYGWNVLDTVAYGCTRRSQAHRWGKWLIDTFWTQTQTATFEVTFDQADLMPGDIVAINDPVYSGIRMAGKIISATTTSITIDKAVDILNGESYQLSIMEADGNITKKTLTNVAGSATVLTWSGALASAPKSFAMWMLEAQYIRPRQFRVIQIIEKEKNIFEVTSLFHDPNKFARVEQDLKLEDPSYEELPSGDILGPTNLSVIQRVYLEGTYPKLAATFSWTPSIDPRVIYYEIQIKEPGGEFVQYIKTSQVSVDVLDVKAGSWGFRVRATTSLGVSSQWSSLDNIGMNLPLLQPEDVSNFFINVLGETAYLTWTPVSNLDLKSYQLRYSPNLTGVDWTSSAVLIEQISRELNSAAVPTRSGTYLIKAINFSDIESANAAIVVTNAASIQNFNVIATFNEHPTWAGVKDGTVSDVFNELTLDTTDDISTWTDISSILDFSRNPGELADIGYYYSDNYIDLGEIFTSRVTPVLKIYGENLNFTQVSDWMDISEVSNWANAEADGFDVIVQTALSDLAHPAGYGAWQDLLVADYTCRSMKWRLILYTFADNVTPKVQEFSISIDMPDRNYGESNLNCTASGLTVTYSPKFRAPPAIVISMNAANTGDYWLTSNETSAGFDIMFFNAGGTPITRSFNYHALGYGYGT